MKVICVKYEDAKRVLENGEKKDLCAKAVAFFEQRMPDGNLFLQLKFALKYVENDPSIDSAIFFFYVLSKYLMGSGPSRKLFPGISERSDNIYEIIVDSKKRYVPKMSLYHITPVENVKDILKKGLVSDTKKIYLTRDIDYLIWFANYKTYLLKRDMKYCVLKIDAPKLGKKQKMYYKFYNIIYTDNIDPCFISLR